MIRCDICKEEVYKSAVRKGVMQVHGSEVDAAREEGQTINVYVKPTSTLCLNINMCEKCSEAMLKEGISELCRGAPDALRDDWRDNE